ncbi:MAG: hypothetical protein ACYTG2_07805 [Planctomycetota bacterium]|jgi:hypothetical protein
MPNRLPFDILPQPTVDTCGPTCLHAVYRHYGDHVELPDVIAAVPALEGGGTLAVNLGRHALGRGYRCTIYSLNLQVFDPSWFGSEPVDLVQKLRAQRAAKSDPKLRHAIDAYLDYLELGGTVEMQPFTEDLMRHILQQKTPILAGLSATWLYRSPREHGPDCEYDDVRGEPAGHFVVLAEYDAQTQQVQVADPFLPNPMAAEHHYSVDIQRAIGAIHLGILTYDANMLVIEPRA